MTSVATVTYGNAITIDQWLRTCPIIVSNNTYPAIFLYKLYKNVCAFNDSVAEYEIKKQNIIIKYGNGTDDYNTANEELLNTKIQISIEMIRMNELKNVSMSYNTLKNLSFMIGK